MKKLLPILLIILSLFILTGQIAIAQSSGETAKGGRFLKRVEYNILAPGIYNFNSKTDVEKLFFGDYNAMIEFFIEPSFEGSYGFRIVKDSLDNYSLEKKRISNWEKINKELSAEFPTKGIPAGRIATITKEESAQNAKYNQEMWQKQKEEALKRYVVATQSVPIGDKFAEKLYHTVTTAIDGFVGKGIPPFITDGYEVTFRCVVEDEVWTLTVHAPQGYIGKLADICKQIIKDIEMGHLDESEYITLLT
ncbi:MAG: hypothetical protein LBN93_02660 [Candidatus Symbiothrix sp.]|jgi:hypothetical protein|nr:hypothetical protein [Candidatus Symbiothrix sp.]